MLVVLLSVLVTVVAAGMVVAYVAYPQRGREAATTAGGEWRRRASAADAGHDD
jgi:uncharacterized protein (UPF0333 family)